MHPKMPTFLQYRFSHYYPASNKFYLRMINTYSTENNIYYQIKSAGTAALDTGLHAALPLPFSTTRTAKAQFYP